jgi:UDP-galactopyranose mutase
MTREPVIVVGAGPAGIGAALTLGSDGIVLEQGAALGGLADSLVIEGAVFDLGGHSFHTPHPEVRDLVFGSLEMYEQQRDARCFAFGELIPYPFQKNYRLLSDTQVVVECSEGLAHADDGKGAENFEAFISRRFGKGIAEHFMLPYNRKLWGRDLKRLAADWTHERVAAPEGVKEEFNRSGGARKPLQGDTRVAYPAQGGFGEIFRALARRIPDIRYRQRVMRIDARRRRLHTVGGDSFAWRHLVSTLPLPVLLGLIDGVPAELKVKAGQLDYLSLRLGLVVVDHPVDTDIQRIYSAEPHVAAHKIAVNHNSSDYLRKLPHHGIISEIAVGPDKPLPRSDIQEWMLAGLELTGLIKDRGDIRHAEIRNVEYAYPVPTHDRDAIVSEIAAWLEEAGIHSVGRFGQWAYINSDEAIHRGMLLGRKLAAH